MRVSLWLCYMQQSLCCASVILASGRLHGLPAPGLRRLAVLTLGCGALAVVGLAADPLQRLMLLLPSSLLTLAAWPSLPRQIRLRMTFTPLLLTWL